MTSKEKQIDAMAKQIDAYKEMVGAYKEMVGAYKLKVGMLTDKLKLAVDLIGKYDMALNDVSGKLTATDLTLTKINGETTCH